MLRVEFDFFFKNKDKDVEKTLRSKCLTRTYKYYNFTKKANVYKNQKKSILVLFDLKKKSFC